MTVPCMRHMRLMCVCVDARAEVRGDRKEGALERRDRLKGRADTPVQHIEARHKQAEALAKQEVEAVLLAQGLDVYKYVEG
jgi:hypothetical protein